MEQLDLTSSSADPAEPVMSSSGRLKLQLAPFRLERLTEYQSGGHHPVHLGDLLGNDRRYRVIHKLGHGGFANIWLCRDLQAGTSYVAVKILLADCSQDDYPELNLENLYANSGLNQPGREYICLPLDSFEIQGPNGRHLCLVLPVLGPKVTDGLFQDSEEYGRLLREICRKAAMGMAFLHSHLLCHGDFTPNNILHGVTGLDGLGEDEVLAIIGQPEQNPVLTDEDKPHEQANAPRYLVYPLDWFSVDRKILTPEPRIIDFGESFYATSPPEDLGTPGPYRSPELMLDNKCGPSSDVWALGCTLFEIRTGRKLFRPFDDDDDDYLESMCEILGKLPEPWWSTTWEIRRRLFKDEVDANGHVVDANPPSEVASERPENVSVHPSVPVGARSLLDALRPGLWHMSAHRPGSFHQEIPEAEKAALADLLGLLLDFDPAKRASVEDALEHEWFRSNF